MAFIVIAPEKVLRLPAPLFCPYSGWLLGLLQPPGGELRGLLTLSEAITHDCLLAVLGSIESLAVRQALAFCRDCLAFVFQEFLKQRQEDGALSCRAITQKQTHAQHTQ